MMVIHNRIKLYKHISDYSEAELITHIHYGLIQNLTNEQYRIQCLMNVIYTCCINNIFRCVTFYYLLQTVKRILNVSILREIEFSLYNILITN